MFSLILSACSDYEINTKDPEHYAPYEDCDNNYDDDGDGDEDEADSECYVAMDIQGTAYEYECYDMLDFGAEIVGLGWSDEQCWATNIAKMYLDMIPSTNVIEYAEILGTGDYPGDSTKIRGIQIIPTGASYPGGSNLASDDVYGNPGSVNGNWSASITDEDLGGFFSQASQPWYPAVEIQDHATAVADECGQVYPDIQFCPTTHDESAMRLVPASTTCDAGSGSFVLVPRRLVDHDNDDNYGVIFDAVMTSGTGTLTNAAWIRTAQVTHNASLGLRLVKVNREIKFNGSDALVDPTVVSIAIGSSTANILSGAVSGGAPWALSEVAGSTQMNPTVSLSWECDTPAEPEEVSSPLGFTLKPSDIGCGGAWPQQFTVRPRPTYAPTSLQIQYYGNAVVNRQVPLHDIGGGVYRIQSMIDGFEIHGTIDDIDANQGMVMTVDIVKYMGTSICQAGTYTLPAEE